MTTPNFQNLPLVNQPYYSRVGLDPGKYQMVAFRPGYPLQASELNEIQEQIYVQQSLNTMMWANWCTFQVVRIANSLGPGWDGATPLTPSLLSVFGNILTVNKGWYLCKMKNSNLYFWLYNNLTPVNFNLTNVNDENYVGFTITTQGIDTNGDPMISGGFVNCQTDPSLRDNSQGTETFCGADRYKIEITSIGSNDSGHTTSFVPIVQKRNNSFVFLNNVTVGTI